jgi:hypothetical protein
MSRRTQGMQGAGKAWGTAPNPAGGSAPRPASDGVPPPYPSAACAAASRATGTRYGEQET